MAAIYDDVRVSPGVLPVEKMLHFDEEFFWHDDHLSVI